MTLANPLGLAGLLSLPVILALHLIRERPPRQVVSHLGLWSFLQQERRGPRSRRLPLTWLLLLDLAAAALLSLAWAQPRLNLNLPAFNARHRVLLIDVSTSMRTRSGLADRLAEAKSAAAALVESAGPRDVVTVLTFGNRARWIADSRQGELPDSITAIRAGETGHALAEALALGLEALDGSRPAEFHILTDGAFPETAVRGVNDLPHPVYWHFSGGLEENRAVLSLNSTPLEGGRTGVFARIANFGNGWARPVIVLEGDGAILDRTRLEIPAEATVPLAWQIDGEHAWLTVRLEGEDGLQLDDSASIPLQRGGRIRVALVAEQPAPLQQALQTLPEVDLEVIHPDDYSAGLGGPPPALTVLRGATPASWPGGPVLVVDPPEGQPSSGSIPVSADGRTEIPADAPLLFPAPDPLLAGIDFSGVRWARAWAMGAPVEGFTTLLQAGEAPLLLRGQAAGSPVWVLLADLERGNFTKHPAFPILIANLVLQTRQSPLPASLPAGEAIVLPLTGGDQRLQLQAPGQEAVDLGPGRPTAWEATLEPGPYRVYIHSAGGETSEYGVGIHAGDPIESDLRPRPWTQAAPAGQGQTTQAGNLAVLAGDDEARPVELLPWLLSAALLLLALEAVLAWR